MAMVEIPDDVLGPLRAHTKARLRTEDAGPLLAQLARSYLADACAPGFDRDGLTKLLSRQSLRGHLNRATFGSSPTDRTIYREKFLCIDLDNFKKYLDVHGLSEGDVVLRDLAHTLQAHYGEDAAYRVGGDEFIVILGDREAWVPRSPPEVSVAHAIVDVAVQRNQRRNHHLDKWIELHLDAGVIASHPQGSHLECGDPSWLDET